MRNLPLNKISAKTQVQALILRSSKLRLSNQPYAFDDSPFTLCMSSVSLTPHLHTHMLLLSYHVLKMSYLDLHPISSIFLYYRSCICCWLFYGTASVRQLHFHISWKHSLSTAPFPLVPTRKGGGLHVHGREVSSLRTSSVESFANHYLVPLSEADSNIRLKHAFMNQIYIYSP